MRRENGTFVQSTGRPRGARNRLTARVFQDVLNHWNEPVSPGGNMRKGQAALELMLKETPSEYVRAVLNILPREIAIESVTSELSDEDLDEMIGKLRAALANTEKLMPLIEAKREG